MDFDPTSYRIMAEEMVREGKTESIGNPASKMLSDARNYLYVDYDIDVSASGQVLRGVAVVNGITYLSDHGLPVNIGLNPRVTDGIGQVAIEVPPGRRSATSSSTACRASARCPERSTASGRSSWTRSYRADGPAHVHGPAGPERVESFVARAVDG